MMDAERPAAPFSGAQRAQRYVEGDGLVVQGSPSGSPAIETATGGVTAASSVVDLTTRESRAGEGAAATSAALRRPGAVPGMTAVTAPTRPAAADWGGRGRLNRGSGGLFRFGPGEGELAHRDAVATVRRATWTRAVNVIVTNPKGGVGKSPTAVILAGILGQIRGGYVCAWEAAESIGSLNRRAEGRPRRGLAELLTHASSVQSAGHLGGYTAPQTSHADIVGSIGARKVLTAHDVLKVRQVLDRYYRITITDTGNNPGHEAYEAALRTADAVVVPCLVSIDALAGVEEVLEVMRAAGGPGSLLSRVVVVLTHDGGPEDPQIATALRARLEELDLVAIVEVPFDPAIRLGGEISLGALSGSSTHAWTRAAAAVVRALDTAPIETDLVRLAEQDMPSVPTTDQQN